MGANYKLQDFNQLRDRDVFVDANVLIYLFWPTGQVSFEKNYARVFNNLLRQGNKLFIDFLILSEVINRVVRIEHQKINPALKFKDFRNSQDGKDVLEDIYIIIKNDILSRFNVVERSFDKQLIESFLIVDELDFIDKAIASVCSEQGMVLLTNDKDFKNSGLDILTGNPRILN
ncbi:type II toxin-antitoxin system VapC family toxin [Marinilabilia salmonicolor]|uniref:type II toxin-antitoxin system VapC family toxin n=1 Tax=Marinilabilia salmonicolor TaxID=989 RepID=UPI00029B1B27|nr:PIN domain-containing protein [Marinilabilia salmonicolor]